MSILKNVAWFTANTAWNGFVAVCFTIVVAACLSASVPGEAAPIGLVEISETPLWWTLALTFGASWAVSFSAGWGAFFANVPWEMLFFFWLIES